jgi:hypothetical protein
MGLANFVTPSLIYVHLQVFKENFQGERWDKEPGGGNLLMRDQSWIFWKKKFGPVLRQIGL